MKIIVGCEESQAVTIELRKLGHEAYSCDLKPCSGRHPEWHIQGDIFEVLGSIKFYTSDNKPHLVSKWDLGIFFPDCTFITCSAEWAYKEPPYHQKLKEGTLFGKERLEARKKAIQFVKDLYNCGIEKVAIENPVGVLSSLFRKPNQVIQPFMFGDDASKKTCLWLKNLPELKATQYVKPRMVNNKPRWGNQTDSGQNKLPPLKNRAELRSKTYPGIAKAMAEQWTKIN